MGPCISTSSTKRKNLHEAAVSKRVREDKKPTAETIENNNNDAILEIQTTNHIKSSAKTQKPATSYDSTQDKENFNDDTLHLTLESQNCLKNIQHRKFLTHFKMAEGNSEEKPEDKRKESVNLVMKRPNFQKQIEQNRIHLKVDLNNKTKGPK